MKQTSSYIISEDNKISVFIYNNQVVINGHRVSDCPKQGHNIRIINNNIYVNGYWWHDNKWQRTFKSWLYNL